MRDYVPREIVVRNDAIVTMRNLVENQFLFKIGIVVSVLGQIAFILLPLVLYKLIGHINAAVLMVIFVLISIPISHTPLIEKYDILDLLNEYIAQTNNDIELTASKVLSKYQRYHNGCLHLTGFLGTVALSLWLFGLQIKFSPQGVECFFDVGLHYLFNRCLWRHAFYQLLWLCEYQNLDYTYCHWRNRYLSLDVYCWD